LIKSFDRIDEAFLLKCDYPHH